MLLSLENTTTYLTITLTENIYKGDIEFNKSQQYNTNQGVLG